MSLKTAYERFLSAPNTQALSDDASLTYITTLTTFQEAPKIVRHLQDQDKNIVKKKSWKVVSGVEGQKSIALEVETSLEFVENGGAYLPRMDSFIIGHEAILPITHFVTFDQDNKISQIRLSWDQGSLLKQVEVIGARGRNWPIFDGKDQIKLIVSSSSSSPAAGGVVSTPPRGRNGDANSFVDRSFSPTKRHIKDPHTSLNLFEQKEPEERDPSAYKDTIAPRQSAKPPPREQSEIFAAGHEDLAPSPGGSPQKPRETIIPPKGASSKRFQTARLFEDDQDDQLLKERKIYKTNPARYNHFDLGDHDENDPMQYRPNAVQEPKKHVPMVSRTNKGQSQWDFDDFNAPTKPQQQKHRDQDDVHFSFDDQARDEGAGKTAGQHKGRKDAETHFDFADQSTPPTSQRRIIARTKAAAKLYSDPVFGEQDDEAPLGNITNNAGRRKNFDSQWDNTDESAFSGGPNKPAPRGRGNRGLESHWNLGEE